MQLERKMGLTLRLASHELVGLKDGTMAQGGLNGVQPTIRSHNDKGF